MRLRNLGPKSQSWLAAVGIETIAQLRSAGAVAAYLLVRQAGFPATLNLLWALEGALRDIDWRTLSEVDKSRLQEELERLTR